jgi:hypothetical protein
MSDDGDEWSSYRGFDFGRSIFGALYGCSSSQPLSAAGRYLQDLERGDSAEIASERDISEELQAQLRRCQIRSMWPSFGGPA